MASIPAAATPDLGAWYSAARLRISNLVDDGVAAVPVPATPLWDVHDLVAHLAGVVTDAANGNMDGVTTEPWTQAQVERGRGKSVAELLAEWDAGANLVEAFLTSASADAADTALLSMASQAVIDVHTHEADLQGALDRPIVLPAEVVAWCADLLRTEFHAAVRDAGLDPVDVDVDDLEVFRSRLGRRTVEEVCAYPWSNDPRHYLATWFVFGSASHPLGERAG